MNEGRLYFFPGMDEPRFGFESLRAHQIYRKGEPLKCLVMKIRLIKPSRRSSPSTAIPNFLLTEALGPGVLPSPDTAEG
jgi:hypothetical protein